MNFDKIEKVNSPIEELEAILELFAEGKISREIFEKREKHLLELIRGSDC